MWQGGNFVVVTFVGRHLCFFLAMALVGTGIVGCRQIPMQVRGDMEAKEQMIRAMLDEISNDVWSLGHDGDTGSDSSITLNSWARSGVQAVRDMGATRVRLIFLEAKLNPLNERDYEIGVSLLVSQKGLSLVKFSEHAMQERPTMDGAPESESSSKLPDFQWPGNWHVWEDAVVRVWNEMVTPGRPLLSFVDRAELGAVMPESLVDIIMLEQRDVDVEDERDGVREWCARYVPDGSQVTYQVRIVPSAAGFLALTEDDEPVMFFSVAFAPRDGGGFEAYSVGYRDLRIKR